MKISIMRAFTVCILLLLCIRTRSSAYEISKDTIRKYLLQNVFPLDSNADAMVLYEKGTVTIDKSVGGTYEEIYHRYALIKILKPNALRLANIKFRYEKSGTVKKIGGNTYNLDNNNNITETKLSGSAVFKRSSDEDFNEVAFALSNVKVGSIIEYYFDQNTDLRILQPKWYFQSEIPILQSEFEFTFPNVFSFIALMHGVKFEDTDNNKPGFNSSSSYRITSFTHDEETSYLWGRKNVPSLKDEPLSGNVRNYAESIQLQLKSAIFLHEDYFNKWEKFDKKLYEKKMFGKQLEHKNEYLKATIDSLVQNENSPLGKAKKIFSYVRANIDCNGDDGLLANKDVKEIFKNRKGNITGVNLLLTAMLRAADLDAYPMILSAMPNISADSLYPMLNSFNYTACILEIESNKYYLDASGRFNSFGSLPISCYNGYARIIKPKNGEGLYLTPDDVIEKRLYLISINNLTDSSMNLQIIEKTGNRKSTELREEWSKNAKDKVAYMNEIMKFLPAHAKLNGSEVYNLNDPDTNLIMEFNVELLSSEPNKTYYLPIDYIKIFESNPFKTDYRSLPIIFPYKEDVMCIVNIRLSGDFFVEDMPKPAEIDCLDNEMKFEEETTYSKDIGLLSARTHFINNSAYYPVDDYKEIRTFFEKILEQENSVFILKKL